MSESNQSSSPDQTDTNLSRQTSNKKTVLTLALLTVLMFGFAFAMVPLYRLICSVAGWNSISTNSAEALAAQSAAISNSDETALRDIKVQFDATINGNVAWEFKPNIRSVTVKPGEKATVSYYVKNHSDKEVITQSIPGITPWQANQHFKKIECFCFETQTLQAGEAKDMTLQFIVDPDLPDDISTITLSYTIMDTNRTESLKPDKSNLPTVGSL